MTDIKISQPIHTLNQLIFPGFRDIDFFTLCFSTSFLWQRSEFFKKFSLNLGIKCCLDKICRMIEHQCVITNLLYTSDESIFNSKPSILSTRFRKLVFCKLSNDLCSDGFNKNKLMINVIEIDCNKLRIQYIKIHKCVKHNLASNNV